MAGVVRVRLFAGAREAVGRRELRRPVAKDGTSLAALLDGLTTEFPALRRVFASCRFAVNGTYADAPTVRVRPGDEVGVHPPYSGG